ncbi:MAG: hypothetical protein IJN43_14535 [Ruminococcus sp.]|nr:hypothetical protein [Ruminococcus sp.]
MKISFEKWLEEHQIPDDAVNLFIESVKCYRIGAYRSSFIMSYIAFQNILRYRILETSFKPNGINDWSTICSKLRDEDEWDKQVAECVKRQRPNTIFCISPSIVSQYENFRCIRNMCAHGKSGDIEYYHIECLWGFIQTYYSRFVVNGSNQGILQMIKDHYDTTITPVGQDLSPIITNIELGIREDEMIDLFESIYQMSKANSTWVNSFSAKWACADLWNKLVNESSIVIQEHIIQFLIQKHTDEIDDFITAYPQTSDLFMTNPQFVRKLWKEIIFKEWSKSKKGTWIILGKVINNNLVPESELDDFHKCLYKFIGKSFDTESVEILKKTDYFTRLKKDLFSEEVYDYPTYITANNNINHIIRYFNIFGLEQDTVCIVNNIIRMMDYGSFIDKIKIFLNTDDNWKQFRKLIKLANKEDYTKKLEEQE